MDDIELQRALRELAARLSRLERLAGITPPIESTPSAPVPPPPPPPAPRDAEPPPAPAPVPEPAIIELIRTPAPPAAPPIKLQAAVPVIQGSPPAKPPRPARQISLEQLIGERWMAWVGALVVVLAAGFFVKLAYDLGWWGRLPPLAKCLISAAFGAALVAGGEIALRRVGRIAAVSLFGAGLGTLYLTAYATFRYFNLLSQSGAFWLMLLVALLGFALTLRGHLVAIGILSLIGGYLSPILLSEQVTFAAALPLYITMLLAVALALSAVLPEPFRLLRYVGIALHLIVATLWAYREGSGHWLIAVSFATLWWALVTAETLWAAFRGQSPRGNPTVSLLFTFWYVSLGCGVLAAANPGERNWLGLFTGCVAAVCAWLALPLGPGVSVLRIRPRRAIERMIAALWAQVGILCAAAIAVQFREGSQSYGMTIGWLVMAVACIELGRRLPSRAVDVFGLLIGLLALVRVWGVDSFHPALPTPRWSYGNLSVSYWAVLVLGAITATQFAARRLRLHGDCAWLWLTQWLTWLSALQWLVLCVFTCRGLALTTGWLVGAAALLAASSWKPSPAYRPAAVFLLLCAAAKWLLGDALGTRTSGAWDPNATQPFANWQMGVALLLFAGACGVYRVYTRRRATAPLDESPADEVAPVRPSAFAGGVLVVAVCFLITALSFEVEHLIGQLETTRPTGAPRPAEDPSQTRLLWFALLWAGGGLAALIYGRARGISALAAAGTAIITLAGLTWLIPGTLSWRIVHGVTLCPVLVNITFGIGLATAAAVFVTGMLLRRDAQPGCADVMPRAAQTAFTAVLSLVLIALAFEIDRWLGHRAAARPEGVTPLWTGWHERALWGTLLAAAGGLLGLVLGRWRRVPQLVVTGWALLIAAGVAWLSVGTLLPRLHHGVTLSPVVLNLQCGVGVLAAVLLAAATWFTARDQTECESRLVGVWLVALIGLWLGSLELDRFFAPAAARVSNPAMARQTAWSVYWALYAIGFVAVGFWKHSAATRYAGLGLLAITLAKVLIVDLAHVQYAYRVLSLLVVGLLLIGTSIAYSRLASVLLRPQTPTTNPTQRKE